MGSALKRGRTLNPQAVKLTMNSISFRIEELQNRFRHKVLTERDRREFRRMTGRDLARDG